MDKTHGGYRVAVRVLVLIGLVLLVLLLAMQVVKSGMDVAQMASPRVIVSEQAAPWEDTTRITYCYANRGTKKYHTPDCEYQPASANRIKYASAAQAEAHGYEPCQICH